MKPKKYCFVHLNECLFYADDFKESWVLDFSDSLHTLQPCSPSQIISFFFFSVILSLVFLSSALVQIVAVVLLSQVVKKLCICLRGLLRNFILNGCSKFSIGGVSS
ncbi:hypothetical protein S83_019103 [Arachis hypogaea]